MIARVLAVLATLFLTGAAAAEPSGYLDNAPLGYVVPPPPSDPDFLHVELAQVRASLAPPGSVAWQEAVADAKAYQAEDVVRRFDDATGEILDEAGHPLLVATLRRIIADSAAYARAAKAAGKRNRPYVEDPAIAPCYANQLQGDSSYPSGHAMNGLVVALVLGRLFPDQEQRILARGLRYGDNRVACGVHHVTDVEQGRLLGVAYWRALMKAPAFLDDLACAGEEAAAPGAAPSAHCRAKLQSAAARGRSTM